MPLTCGNSASSVKTAWRSHRPPVWWFGLSQATILLAASACGSAACSTGTERAVALGHGLLALAKEAADPA
jgi:hypothetical protein